jgi:hypothetical protein
MKFALVVPNNRILKNDFVKSYYYNFTKFNHRLEDIKLIVVDDFSPYINENLKILNSCGLEYEYWTVEKQKEFFQKEFGKSWKKFYDIIPHRTDACRSFGYLIATLWNADIIITLDDDNYAIYDKNSSLFDYLGSHSVINKEYEGIAVFSNKGWINTIQFMVTSPRRKIYARGYPYTKRGEAYYYNKCKKKIVVNVGLWLNNPDVDSITVLSEGSMNGLPKTKTTGLKRSFSRIILGDNMFAPINTANTAYSIKLLPIIYDTFQGYWIGDLKLDRFGDIWSNLFLLKILHKTGDGVTIGTPLVTHNREPRNTFDDFKKEFWGIIISEKIFELIERINLTSKNYTDLYLELILYFEKEIYKDDSIPQALKKYFKKLFSSMRNWVKLCEKLGLI